MKINHIQKLGKIRSVEFILALLVAGLGALIINWWINRHYIVGDRVVDGKKSQLVEEGQEVTKDVNESVLLYGIAAGGRLTHFDQSRLDNYFSQLNDLGVSWVRWDIDWNFVQPDGPDTYDWKNVDRVIDTAEKYGIKSLVTLAYAPKWASHSNCKYPGCHPKDISTYSDFAREAAARYNGRINYFEIWNEPNLDLFWNNPNVSDYFELLKDSYLNIKKENPSAIIMSGGLAAIEDNHRGGGISPFTFLNDLYGIGGGQYLDAVALHPYTYPLSPQFHFLNNHWLEMPQIRKLMVENGDEHKKIWITEFGAPTGGRGDGAGVNKLFGFDYGSDFMTDEAHSHLLSESIDYYEENNTWIAGYFWYTLFDKSDNEDTVENFFGLIRFDGSKKPAYDTFRELLVK